MLELVILQYVKNPYDQKFDKKEELELIFTIYLSDFNKMVFEKATGLRL